MEKPSQPTSDSSSFSPRCVSIDLEVGVKDARIHRMAAVRGDSDRVFTYEKGGLAQALDSLD